METGKESMIRTKYGLDLVGLSFLDERVEDDNVLALCAWSVHGQNDGR